MNSLAFLSECFSPFLFLETFRVNACASLFLDQYMPTVKANISIDTFESVSPNVIEKGTTMTKGEKDNQEELKSVKKISREK